MGLNTKWARRPCPAVGACVTFLWLISAQAAAAEREPHPIDLVTVLRLAGADNLAVKFVEERVREARANENRAALWYFPSLAVGASLSKHEGQIQETAGRIIDASKSSAGANMGLELTVNPVKGMYEKLAARQVRLAREAERQRTFNETLSLAATQYYDLVRAYGLARIAENAVARSKELVRYQQSLVDRGAGVEADAARAKAQLARDEQSMHRAAEAIAIASAQLATTLRLAPAVELKPIDEAIRKVTLIDESLALGELMGRTMAHRPEIAESVALRGAAEQGEKSARYGPFVPEIGASATGGAFGGGRGGRFGDFSDREDYAVFLRWRLEGFGFGDRERLRAAQSRHRQAEIALARTEDEIRREVVEQERRLISLAHQVAAADQEVQAASESLRLNEARSRAGAGIALEVLQAQQALTEAGLNHLNAIVEYNKAQHRFLRILGEAPPADLSERP